MLKDFGGMGKEFDDMGAYFDGMLTDFDKASKQSQMSTSSHPLSYHGLTK